MNGRTHLMLGLAAGVAVAATVPEYTGLVFPGSDHVVRAGLIFIAGVASLLPDIDHPKSLLSGYAIGIGGAVRMLASHRTWTHSLLFMAVIVGITFWASGQGSWTAPALAALIGMSSHILADMATPAGVPILLPLSRRSFRIAPFRVLTMTSWLLESVATVGAMVVIGLFVMRGTGLIKL